ncbi:MAG TPA: VWA domain-containing protein [Spongiibacteraceae bacterium]
MSAATTTAPIENLAGFAALLRDHGLKVGVSEQQSMIAAALSFTQPNSAQISAAWRAIACHSAKDWRQWPELFERYWFPHKLKGTVRVSGQTRPSRNLREVLQTMHQKMDEAASRPNAEAQRRLAAGLDAAPEHSVEVSNARQTQGGATRTEALHDRELSQWSPQDLQGLQQIADRIAAQLRRRLTRRWCINGAGSKLDVRRTLRDSVAVGGLPIYPAWRRQRREQPRLFILVDVSRSMESHAQLFLRIARAFVQAARARVFVFHTRLAEVTPLLQRDSGAVQEKINAVTAGFGGGTRIATSINDFVRAHARSQINRGSRVWILSDGFDADPADQLAQSLDEVHRRGAKITWFHPTRGVPASAAMQTAIAHTGIDRFVPLATLKDLFAARTVLQ